MVWNSVQNWLAIAMAAADEANETQTVTDEAAEAVAS